MLGALLQGFLLAQKRVNAVNIKIQLNVKLHLQCLVVSAPHRQRHIPSKPGKKRIPMASIEGSNQLLFQRFDRFDRLFKAFEAVFLEDFKGVKKIIFEEVLLNEGD